MRLFCLFILFTFAGNLSFVSSAMVSKGDSLSAVLSRTTDAGRRLQILQDLSRITLDNPRGLYWLRLLEKEAAENHRRSAEDWAFRYLARHYYNAGMGDSLYYYAGKSDSLAKVMRQYTDFYYDTQSFLSQFML